MSRRSPTGHLRDSGPTCYKNQRCKEKRNDDDNRNNTNKRSGNTRRKRTQHTESGHSYSRSASKNTVRNLSQAGKERTKERERTNERTERNGTEDGHGSTATSSRCGAGRLESPVGRGVRPLQQDHQGASGLESFLLLGATQSSTTRVHVPSRTQTCRT